MNLASLLSTIVSLLPEMVLLQKKVTIPQGITFTLALLQIPFSLIGLIKIFDFYCERSVVSKILTLTETILISVAPAVCCILAWSKINSSLAGLLFAITVVTEFIFLFLAAAAFDTVLSKNS